MLALDEQLLTSDGAQPDRTYLRDKIRTLFPPYAKARRGVRAKPTAEEDRSQVPGWTRSMSHPFGPAAVADPKEDKGLPRAASVMASSGFQSDRSCSSDSTKLLLFSIF